jgi:hypothetical protein
VEFLPDTKGVTGRSYDWIDYNNRRLKNHIFLLFRLHSYSDAA